MPTTADGYRYDPVPRVSGTPPFPPEQVQRSKNLFRATLDMFQQDERVGMLAGYVFGKYPVHAERARGGSAIIGVDPVELVAANLCYDLLMGASAMGCSTLALAGAAGPTLARNMDWFPADKVAQASCLVDEEFGVNAGFVGLLGAVTGLSRRGFCVCLNAAFGGFDLTGYPMLLFLRHVLDTAPDYTAALDLVTHERLMSGGIITLVGTRNAERAVVERSPTEAAVRLADGDAPLMATNHFRARSTPEACPRYEYMAARAGTVPALDLLMRPEVLQDITAQHVVMCPAAQTVEMFVPTRLTSADSGGEMSVADIQRYFAN